MSAPIRSLPPRAVGPSAPAAETEVFPQSRSGFSDLLDSKVEDAPDTGADPNEKPASSATSEPWTILGVTSLTPPPIIQNNPPPEGVALEGDGKIEIPIPDIEPRNKPVEAQAEGKVNTSESEGIIDAKVLMCLAPNDSKQKLPTGLKSEPKEEQIAGKVPERAGITGGTPSAKQPSMMLTSETHLDRGSVSERMEISSGESTTTAAREGFIPSATFIRSKEDIFRPESHKNSIEAFLSPAPLRNSEFSDIEIMPRPLTHLEATKLVESVNSQIQLLRSSQIGELKVIVRPDAQTELYLHITRVNGDVCVQARCERGDFSWLDANWSVVQNALGTQGVKVEPLQTASRTPEQPNHGFSGEHHSPRRDERTSEREFAMDAAPVRQKNNLSRSTTTTSRARGWQSWA